MHFSMVAGPKQGSLWSLGHHNKPPKSSECRLFEFRTGQARSLLQLEMAMTR